MINIDYLNVETFLSFQSSSGERFYDFTRGCWDEMVDVYDSSASLDIHRYNLTISLSSTVCHTTGLSSVL